MSRFDVMSLKPADTPDYMAPAWLSCLGWALGEAQIVEAFRAETGNRWQPGRSGIERAIDAATGVDVAFFEAFIPWFNANVWGPIELPEGDA